MERVMSRKEAATLLRISVDTLDAARKKGQISYVQYVPKGAVYFTKDSLQEYVAKCTFRAKQQDNMRLTYRRSRTISQ